MNATLQNNIVATTAELVLKSFIEDEASFTPFNVTVEVRNLLRMQVDHAPIREFVHEYMESAGLVGTMYAKNENFMTQGGLATRYEFNIQTLESWAAEASAILLNSADAIEASAGRYLALAKVHNKEDGNWCKAMNYRKKAAHYRKFCDQLTLIV